MDATPAPAISPPYPATADAPRLPHPATAPSTSFFRAGAQQSSPPAPFASPSLSKSPKAHKPRTLAPSGPASAPTPSPAPAANGSSSSPSKPRPLAAVPAPAPAPTALGKGKNKPAPEVVVLDDSDADALMLDLEESTSDEEVAAQLSVWTGRAGSVVVPGARSKGKGKGKKRARSPARLGPASTSTSTSTSTTAPASPARKRPRLRPATSGAASSSSTVIAGPAPAPPPSSSSKPMQLDAHSPGRARGRPLSAIDALADTDADAEDADAEDAAGPCPPSPAAGMHSLLNFFTSAGNSPAKSPAKGKGKARASPKKKPAALDGDEEDDGDFRPDGEGSEQEKEKKDGFSQPHLLWASPPKPQVKPGSPKKKGEAGEAEGEGKRSTSPRKAKAATAVKGFYEPKVDKTGTPLPGKRRTGGGAAASVDEADVTDETEDEEEQQPARRRPPTRASTSANGRAAPSPEAEEDEPEPAIKKKVNGAGVRRKSGRLSEAANGRDKGKGKARAPSPAASSATASAAGTTTDSDTDDGSSSHASDADSLDGLSGAALLEHYSAFDVSAATVRTLEGKAFVDPKTGGVKREGKGWRGYRKARFSADAVDTIAPGQVVDVKTGTARKKGWYMVVEDIRALKDDIESGPTAGNSGRTMASTLYVRGSWLYSASDFGGKAPDGKPWKDRTWHMGPNERVKTDHQEWRASGMLRSQAGPETLYVFDDSYPAPPPGRSTPTASSHPLAHYRTSALKDFCPTPYAAPALRGDSPPPPTSKSAHAAAPPSEPLPSYFFGVGAQRGREGRGGEKLPDRKGRRGGDGRRGTAWVRVGFSWNPQEREEDEVSWADEEVIDEEEVKLENGRGAGGEGMGKGKGGGKGKGKTVKIKPGAKRVFPLAFKRHSLSRTPYDPRKVQRYSRAAKEWYSVKDLWQGGYVVPAPGADGQDGQEGQEDDAEEVQLKTVQRAARKGGAVNFSLDIPVGARSISSCSATAGAGSSRTPSRVSNGATPAQPQLTAEEEQAASAAKGDLHARLEHLSQQPIVRGGAYGLTGNAYLVTRAGELVAALLAASLAPPASDNASSTLEGEASGLLAAHAAWAQEVQDRVDGVGEGYGLAREWRRTGDEKLEEGERWRCPVSEEAI
ncbi:hypothetical protein JCM10207_007137 [Rhodosporidiobolus poonsookiae]